MTKINPVENCIIENIRDEDVVFVFPTEIACKAWADWTVKNKDKTGVSAVSMERFIAWDKFKGECIKTKQVDKTTIPSLMRKIFASYLIEKNAEIKKSNIQNNQNNPLLFKTLITSEYAENASSFSDWISGILPSLKMWHNYHESESYEKVILEMKAKAEAEGKKFVLTRNDDEDDDFQTLYEEYGKFLEENKLFDPAWEEPPFVSDAKTKYAIIYPQVLEDWSQYEYLLKRDSQVNDHKLFFVDVPDAQTLEEILPSENVESKLFNTSVEELHDVALYLRHLHDEEKIDWKDISINVPNMETYGSYLERELNLFEIPNVMRYSRMLSEHGAGQMFTQIQECVRSDFSFESLKSLLLNDDIPWKNKYLINKLIMFGKENNCVCSFNVEGKHFDIWEESFRNPVKSIREALYNKNEELSDEIKQIRQLYRTVKFNARKMVQAKTFEELLKAYRTFRKRLIDRKGFKSMKSSDLILSRCISELTEIVGLEKEFENYKIKNVYGFFLAHLNKTQYLNQTEERGIQIYPYRAAAALPCKVHIVVDSTQNSLSVGSVFKQLSFLNESKRDIILQIDPSSNDRFFKFTDFDPSEAFITLYQLSSEKKAYFTSSEHSMSGYGFPHGFLKTDKKKDIELTPFVAEKFTLTDSNGQIPKKLFLKQKSGFDNWKKNKVDGGFVFENFQSEIRKIIDKKFLISEKKSPFFGKYKISSSNLKAFNKCPRQWLFEKVLGIKPLNNEADLMNDFIIGKINHAIFEIYLTQVKKKSIFLSETLEQNSLGIEVLKEEYKNVLEKAIDDATKRFTDLKNLSDDDLFGDTLSVMTKTIVLSQKSELFEKIYPSLLIFTKEFKNYEVAEIEKEYNYAPPNKNYYLTGRIDCILKKAPTADDSPDEYCIVDFKTSVTPSPLLCDESIDIEEVDYSNISKMPDFQMPIYKKLFSETPICKESDGTEVKITPTEYFFYSIKKKEVKIKPSSKSKPLTPESMQKTCELCDKFIDLFYERVLNKFDENGKEKSLDFGINRILQGKNTCAVKGEFGNGCKDYQAICRRFFTVAGRE